MSVQMITYVAIGVAFIINLIITLAFRLVDKKDRTLKNVNTQIKNFRTEVSTTIARVNATAKDCEVNIQARVDQANQANSMLAESLDMLMVHQKELSDLEYICKSYKTALEKLRVQTEQAEARILAVQGEVRKAESINEFTLAFQADAERLTNQMQDLKAEYVRLIASTEQSLRLAGQTQLEENNRNLAAFSETLDRTRSELADFANNEKIAIQDLFNHQELATQEALDNLDKHNSEIKADIDDAVRKLDQYMDDLNERAGQLEEKKNALGLEVDEIVKKYREDLESTGEAVANTLESSIRDREDELNTVAESVSEKLNQKEGSVEKLLEDLESKKALMLSSLDSALENKQKEFNSLSASIDNEKEMYSTKCRDAMEKAYNDALSGAQKQVESLKGMSDELAAHLFERIADTKEAYSILSSGMDEKLSQGIKSLSELDAKTKTANATFNTLSESITQKRQELYDLNRDSQNAREELEKINSDMEKAKEDAQKAKEDRINEEAMVVRLKFQQSSLKKEGESEKKAPSQNVKKEHKKAPSEMIEAFPDDIEIDLSDDDE